MNRNKDNSAAATRQENVVVKTAEFEPPWTESEPAWMRRPERPAVGPQAQYSITGTNIACGSGPYIATFVESRVEKGGHFQAEIEWLMYNFARFDEPSRHMLLASVATHYGVAYSAIFGDEQ